MHQLTAGGHVATAPIGEHSPRAVHEGRLAEVTVEQVDRLHCGLFCWGGHLAEGRAQV